MGLTLVYFDEMFKKLGKCWCIYNVNLELFVQATNNQYIKLYRPPEASPTVDITTVSCVTLVDWWRCVDFPTASVGGG